MNMLNFAHNGIDHINHTHHDAAHTSQPNVLLWITAAAVLIAAIYFVSKFLGQHQSAQAERKKRK